MIRITKQTDYGIVLLTHLADERRSGRTTLRSWPPRRVCRCRW